MRQGVFPGPPPPASSFRRTFRVGMQGAKSFLQKRYFISITFWFVAIAYFKNVIYFEVRKSQVNDFNILKKWHLTCLKANNSDKGTWLIYVYINLSWRIS
jgi:hypothetical protein